MEVLWSSLTLGNARFLFLQAQLIAQVVLANSVYKFIILEVVEFSVVLDS